MEKEHQELFEIMNERKNPHSLFLTLLFLFSLLSAGTQSVLMCKSIFLDKDIAVAGFSLFLFALFILLLLLSLKKVSARVMFWVSIFAPIVSGTAASTTFAILGAGIAMAIVGFFASSIFLGLISWPICFSTRRASP